MTFWLLAAFLLLFTLFGVVWPMLSRSARQVDASDIQIYKDQLREIERDIDRGTVEKRDGEASRTEISRRLLKASQNQRVAQVHSKKFAQIAAIALLVAVPAGAIGTYWSLGSPQTPDAPLQARLEAIKTQTANNSTSEDNRLDELVAGVEAHLKKNPEDGQGWLVVAPVYRRLGQIDDAVKAYENALRYTPKTADLWSAYAESAIMQASGVIPRNARRAFEEARKLDAGAIKPRFYLALSLSQDQDHAAAVTAWRALLQDAPEGAPWARIAKAHLIEAEAGAGIVAGAAAPTSEAGSENSESSQSQPAQRQAAEALPGPGKEDVQAAQSLSVDDRKAFINSMVEGLQSRLNSEGGKVEEWIRLVRAYTVLGKSEEARSAFEKARGTFAEDERASALLNGAAAEFGISTE